MGPKSPTTLQIYDFLLQILFQDNPSRSGDYGHRQEVFVRGCSLSHLGIYIILGVLRKLCRKNPSINFSLHYKNAKTNY